MISHPLEVATCIACGARSRHAECPDGCHDVALEFVEVVSLEPLETGLGPAGAREAALRAARPGARATPRPGPRRARRLSTLLTPSAGGEILGAPKRRWS